MNIKIAQAINLIDEHLAFLKPTNAMFKIEIENYKFLKRKLEHLLTNQYTPMSSIEIFLECSSINPHFITEGSTLKGLLNSISSEIFHLNYELINQGKLVSIKYEPNKIPVSINLTGIEYDGDKISYYSLMPLIKERVIRLINKSLQTQPRNKDIGMRNLCSYVYQNLNIHPHSYTTCIETLAFEIMNSKEFKQFKIDLWKQIRKFEIDNISRNSMIPVQCNFVENDCLELFVASLTSTKVDSK